jgi:hypothetical protein
MLGKPAGLAMGDAVPDDNVHAIDDARNLRVRFPRRGMLFDPLEGVWVAVRGRRMLVAAGSPEKLTELLPEPFIPAAVTTGQRPGFLCDG